MIWLFCSRIFLFIISVSVLILYIYLNCSLILHIALAHIVKTFHRETEWVKIIDTLISLSASYTHSPVCSVIPFCSLSFIVPSISFYPRYLTTSCLCRVIANYFPTRADQHRNHRMQEPPRAHCSFLSNNPKCKHTIINVPTFSVSTIHVQCRWNAG